MPYSADTTSDRDKRVVIIGLAGASFDLIDPLIDSGLLPHLATLKTKSAYGNLNSTNPPTALPAWTTFTTGVNPGRHGIFDFTDSPLKNPRRPLVTSNSVRSPRLWHILETQNRRSVFINVPVTYPPEKIQGCMISGMMTPNEQAEYTWPPDLKTRLKAHCGHYIPNIDFPGYDITSLSDALAYLNKIHEAIQRRHEAVRHLLSQEEWNVFMVVFIGLDRILHLFAKYLFPENPLYHSSLAQKLRSRLHKEIQFLDTMVGDIASHCAPEDSFIVMSAHGFGATEQYFNANAWLKSQHLLAVKPLPYLKKQCFHRVQSLGNCALIRSIIPTGIQSIIRSGIRRGYSSFNSPCTDLNSVVDFSRTKAFFGSTPSQGIYINQRTEQNPDGIVSKEETEILKQMIKDQLLKLHHPETGDAVTDEVWFREELYDGPETKFAPHIIFRMANYSVLGRQYLGASGFFSRVTDKPIGFHRSNGMMMIRDSHVKPGETTAELADILPTALYLAGLRIPQNLNGAVLKKVIQDSHLQSCPIQYLDTDTHQN